jgi:hypothetical protein
MSPQISTLDTWKACVNSSLKIPFLQHKQYFLTYEHITVEDDVQVVFEECTTIQNDNFYRSEGVVSIIFW